MDGTANIALVSAGGDLDVTTCPRLRSAIDGLVDQGCRRIILNMADVTRIDSTGMALIIGEIRAMREVGGLLSLVNVSDHVMRSLRLARVVDYAPVSVLRKGSEISDLNPDIQPIWRRALSVSATTLGNARDCIGRALQSSPLNDDETFDAVLAIGEALGNAIDHTQEGTAIVSLSCYPDRVVAEVTDRGCGFDPSEVETRSCGEYAERGRGIQLMRLLADAVAIGPRNVGQGTMVRITKMAHRK